MNIGNRILSVYEDINLFPPALPIAEYLKYIPREICIRYGLLISNYTADDDICTQIQNLGLTNKIPRVLLNKLTEDRISNDTYVLFFPQTGLELLRQTFNIKEEDFKEHPSSSFSILPLVMAILRINSELIANGSHFKDKSAALFPKQMRSRKYELDDRIMIYPLVYRMFCLLHFFEKQTNTKWVKLRGELLLSLGTQNLREYFISTLHIIGKCNLEPKINNTIFRTHLDSNMHNQLTSLSFDTHSTIELKDNVDYRYFKQNPLIKLNDTEFGVINNLFLANQIYTSLKFRMQKISPNFFSMFNKDFVEGFLLNRILKYAFGHEQFILLSEKDCSDILCEKSHPLRS